MDAGTERKAVFFNLKKYSPCNRVKLRTVSASTETASCGAFFIGEKTMKKNWNRKTNKGIILFLYIASTLALTFCANAKDVTYNDSWGEKVNITVIRGVEKQGDILTPTFCFIKKDGKKRAFVFATDNLDGNISHERYNILLEQIAGANANDAENWSDNLNKKVSFENGTIKRTSRNSKTVTTFEKTSDNFTVYKKPETVIAAAVVKKIEAKEKIAFLKDKTQMIKARKSERDAVLDALNR